MCCKDEQRAFVLSYLVAIAVPPVFAQNYRQCYDILARGKYPQAEKCLSRLIALYPENAKTQFLSLNQCDRTVLNLSVTVSISRHFPVER